MDNRSWTWGDTLILAVFFAIGVSAGLIAFLGQLSTCRP